MAAMRRPLANASDTTCLVMVVFPVPGPPVRTAMSGSADDGEGLTLRLVEGDSAW